MSKAVISVTNSWVQIAAGVAVFTVKKRGTGALMFNETASDTAAYECNPNPEDQYEQNSIVATHVRTTGAGWELIADGTL